MSLTLWVNLRKQVIVAAGLFLFMEMETTAYPPYPEVPLAAMGIPSDWQTLALWQ